MSERTSSYRRRLLERLAVSLLVSTLLFSGKFAVVLDESNRFYGHWGLRDAFALFSAVAGLAALGVFVSVIVDLSNARWLKRVFEHVFLIALASGVLTLVRFGSSGTVLIPAIWIAILSAVGLSFVRPDAKIVSTARAAALVFSPLVPILLVTLLMLPRWDPEPFEPIAFEHPAAAKTPVFLFVFDAWSYRESVAGGEFRGYFKNLRELGTRSFVFRNARSAGGTTNTSLPQIIYQRDIRFDEQTDAFGPWIHSEDPGPGFESLFARMKSRGYQNALIGSYFPYGRIFDPDLDHVFTRSVGTLGDSFSEKLAGIVVTNLLYLNDPISKRTHKALIRSAHSQNRYDLARRFFEQSYQVLSNGSSNTFGFFHLPYPHWPYVFNPDGTYFGDEGNDYRGPADDAGYVRQLKYLDRVIGEIVARLREAELFDSALLILTADHGSLAESRHPDLVTRVPLIIKLPNQSNPHVVDREFRNNHLWPIVDAVLSGSGSEQSVSRLIANSGNEIQKSDVRRPADPAKSRSDAREKGAPSGNGTPR